MAVNLMSELGDIESAEGDEMTTMLQTKSIEMDDEFFEIKATVKSYINDIKKNAKAVDQHTNKYKISSSKSEYIQITNTIDEIVQNNGNITSNTRSMISAQKNTICNTETSSKSLKVIEFNHLVQSFRESTHIFHVALNGFDVAVRDKQMRQIHFLKDDIKDNDIERLERCDYQQRQQWIEKTMQLADDRTLDRLIDLEDQRDEMLKIEQSIRELKELYETLHTLVVDQGMLIDEVEKHVEHARDQVQQGLGHLDKAAAKQNQTRKMKCRFFGNINLSFSHKLYFWKLGLSPLTHGHWVNCTSPHCRDQQLHLLAHRIQSAYPSWFWPPFYAILRHSSHFEFFVFCLAALGMSAIDNVN
eukprot:718806_1